MQCECLWLCRSLMATPKVPMCVHTTSPPPPMSIPPPPPPPPRDNAPNAPPGDRHHRQRTNYRRILRSIYDRSVACCTPPKALKYTLRYKNRMVPCK